eukprot:1006458_1
MAMLHLFFIIACTLNRITLSKVYEIYHRDHYHDEMQDMPVGYRYASVLAFYNDTKQCQGALKSLPFTETGLPSIEHLFLGQYEFSTSRERVWYVYEEHLDLPQYIGINDYMYSKDDCECPILAFIPAAYADALTDDYLINPPTNGIQIWNSEQESDWKIWTWKNLEKTVRIIINLPYNFEVTVNHQTINTYLPTKGISWTESTTINAILSHVDITVWPGDTIYISKNPELPAQLKKKRKDKKMKKPTPSTMNPTYVVTAGMNILNVIEYDDNTWGFDWYQREDISASFIARRHSTTLMTHTRNLIIPRILPSTHPKGFIKRKMPPTLHDRLVKFYRKWYHLRAEESWDRSGTQLNYYNVKTHMISLDHDYHERDSIANDIMKPVLLEWARANGAKHIKELKFTALYGIREYSRGASLRNHVDRVDTHVLSAVLQVAQTGVEQPWPLQVIGFDGKLVDVMLEPGEMILYEGHKLIHGRPYPFNGTIFANAFIHFCPVDWEWSTSKIWRTPDATNTLKKMHMDMRSIYR